MTCSMKSILTAACALGTGLALSVGPPPAQAAPKRSYQTLRWAEDWSWVGHEMADTDDAFDSVKNVPMGGDWAFTLGGSFRLRYENDDNRGLGKENGPIQLFRSFLHFEIAHADNFRWFVEGRYSDTWNEDAPAPAIFRDDPDIQNFFIEFTAAADSDHPVDVRVGRQELLFGAQRLVSPLNWSSTRRTFDGLTVTAKTPRTNTVLFATSPVAHEVHDIDSPIDDQIFGGVHATFLPGVKHRFEGYFYWQDDSRDFKSEDGRLIGDTERRTFGLRYVYGQGGWKLDVEAALQDGNIAQDEINAHMVSATLGYHWKEAAWSPALEVGVDVASGDGDPTDGKRETFNQLFPLGHAYFGHVDNIGRQNVEAARVQLALKPAKNLKWVTAIHKFRREDDGDFVYNAGGGTLRPSNDPAHGEDVGTELDTMLAWSFGTHHSVAVEFVKWWSDEFIENSGDPDDAWFAWAAYEFKF